MKPIHRPIEIQTKGESGGRSIVSADVVTKDCGDDRTDSECDHDDLQAGKNGRGQDADVQPDEEKIGIERGRFRFDFADSGNTTRQHPRHELKHRIACDNAVTTEP